MLWSEVPSIINTNGCFFWRPAKHKIQKTTLNWGTGGTWPLWHGTSWDGCFFKEPGLGKGTIGLTHGCRQKRIWWRHGVRESIGISLGGCLCVCGCVCLLARARMCQNWLCCGKHIQRQTGHLFALIPQCCGVHWLVVLRDRRATLRAWLLYPTHLLCNAHATHMQHTCDTKCNMSFSPVNLQSTCRIWRLQPPTPVLEWKMSILAPAATLLGNLQGKCLCCICVACVLHVCCIGRPIQITPLNWGSRKTRGRRKSCRWQGRDFGSWAPWICNKLHCDGGP